MEPASAWAFRRGHSMPAGRTPPTLRGMRPMRTLIASLAFALLVLTLPAAAQEPAGPKAQSVLTPGDSVRIVVWRKPEFSGDFVIAPDGTITHPLFRTVRWPACRSPRRRPTSARSCGQFEENPQFVMEPLIRVAVSGEVTRPLVFAARPETTDRRGGGPRRRHRPRRRPQPCPRDPAARRTGSRSSS